MRILKLLIGWPLSLISLFFIGRIILSRANELPSFNEFNIPVLFFAGICFFFYAILRAFLWQRILEGQRYKLPFKDSLKHWVFSEFKRYTPGNIWSLVGRVLSFESLGVKKKDSAKALLYEAELVVVGGALGSLLALPVIFKQFPNFSFGMVTQPLIFYALFILVIFLSIAFIFAKRMNSPIFPRFNYKLNLQLVVISFLSLLLFGIGSYLTTISLFYLDPRNIFILAGFYIFALLVGYLSLVTPMGLGVREAVLFFGLLLYLPAPQTAIAVIFARVWFIISELIFVSLVWLWSETKNYYLEKLEKLVSKNLGLSAVFALALVYTIYMTYASFLRFDNFYAGRFDLGNMDQTVWNTINGRIFMFTNPDGTEEISRLAFHSDFLLILLSPLYWIWANPKMLLLVQSLVLAVGGIFVYLIASKYIRNKFVPLIIAFIYFINPSMNNSNLYEFHAVVLATTLLLASFYFLRIKKIFAFLISLFLAAISKEHVWLTTGLVGLYLFFFQKNKQSLRPNALKQSLRSYNLKLIGFLIFLVSLVSFIYLMEFAFPNAAKGEHFALEYYSQFGDSPSEVIRNTLLSPQKVIPILFDGSRLYYLNQLFLPFSYFLFSPYIIFALPDLAINFLSRNPNLYKTYFQYTAIITPFLFISLIWTFAFLKKNFPRISLNMLAILILVTSLYSAWKFGPLPGAENPNLGMFNHPLKNREVVDDFIAKIPAEYKVSATNNVGSKISQRRYIYVIPHGTNNADMIIFLLRRSPNDPIEKGDRENLEKVRLNKDYVEVFRDGGFFVFQRKDLPLLPN